ncbi:MAG TPA: radical SAM protein [Bacteroidota bacterium]|nr:radical SAM protein [Bacteroidota bacterium]
MNFKAFLNTRTLTCRTLPIVILYVTEGCNLKCITCSYRQSLPNELSIQEIEAISQSLKDFGLRHIVYSGGEPLIRRDFPEICEIFARIGVKQTLLTNGLLLEKRYEEIANYFSEIIISLDGARAETHNRIRGVESFDRILEGIGKVFHLPDKPELAIRTVLQKENYREVVAMVELAKKLGVDRITFLAADVLSGGFGRDTRGQVVPDSRILLDKEEAAEFSEIMNRLISEHHADIRSGFIGQSEDQLRHIVHYFEALNGMAPFPRNNCNAPMVSAVITSTGEVQPCFFLPTFGNLRGGAIDKLMNTPAAVATRRDVRDYTLERCQQCVCTLSVDPVIALLDKF